MIKLSVIIVNYNVKYFLEQCLHSIYKASEGINTEVFVEIGLSEVSPEELIQEFNKNNVTDFSQKLETAFIQKKHKHLLQNNAITIIDAFKKELQNTIEFPVNDYKQLVEEIQVNNLKTNDELASIARLVENNIIETTAEITRKQNIIDAINKEKLYTDLELEIQKEKQLRNELALKAMEEKVSQESNFMHLTKNLEGQISLLTQQVNELEKKLYKNDYLISELQKENEHYKSKYEDKSIWSIVKEKLKQ